MPPLILPLARVVRLRRASVTSHSTHSTVGVTIMSQLLRVGAAGYGASRLGGGCIGTILVFIILFWLLGYVF
jgi:hypothetical protein